MEIVTTEFSSFWKVATDQRVKKLEDEVAQLRAALDEREAKEAPVERGSAQLRRARNLLDDARADRARLAKAVEELLDDHHGNCAECSADGPCERTERYYALVQETT